MTDAHLGTPSDHEPTAELPVAPNGNGAHAPTAEVTEVIAVVPEPKKPKAPRALERPALVPASAIPIDAIEPDDHFKLRETGDVAGLATSLARVGQLFAIDVRPRGGSFQVVAGFRRLAALHVLQRGTVLARVHAGMTDAEAWVFALAQALESRGLTPEEIIAVRERLSRLGQLSPMNRGLIEAALTVPGSDLEPEDPHADPAEEVDLDELAIDLRARLEGISADLSLVTDLWAEMEPRPRAALLEQLKYYADLHAYLSRLR